VKKLILTAIRRVSGYVRMNEDEFVQKVREASKIQQVKTAKECKRRIREAQKRYNELDGMVKKLYESYAAGKLPDRHYQRLLAEYDAEQAGLEKTMADFRTELDSFNADSVRVDKFIQLVKRYTDFSELTTPMLNEFVEKVIVHEADKSTGERIQKVDICLNFIGRLDLNLPDEDLSPEEIEKERKRQKRNNHERTANRERMRLYREKQQRLKAAVNH